MRDRIVGPDLIFPLTVEVGEIYRVQFGSATLMPSVQSVCNDSQDNRTKHSADDDAY